MHTGMFLWVAMRWMPFSFHCLFPPYSTCLLAVFWNSLRHCWECMAKPIQFLSIAISFFITIGLCIPIGVGISWAINIAIRLWMYAFSYPDEVATAVSSLFLSCLSSPDVFLGLILFHFMLLHCISCVSTKLHQCLVFDEMLKHVAKQAHGIWHFIFRRLAILFKSWDHFCVLFSSYCSLLVSV